MAAVLAPASSVALHVTRFPDVLAMTYTPTETTFEALAEGLRLVKQYPTKESCPLLKLARFNGIATESGCLRHDENVSAVSGVEGDHDAGTMTMQEAVARLDLAGVQAILYTSARHTEAHPRWRVLAPFSEERPPEARIRFAARLNGVLGGVLAAESFSLSQTFYFGRVKGADYQTAKVDGSPIDTHDVLDAGAVYPTARGADERDSAPDDLSRQLALQGVNDETIADLRSALEAMKPERAADYGDWIKVGQALKSVAQAGREADALELWHAFSARSPEQYNAENADAKWGTFAPGKITYRSIFDIAKQDGWANPRGAQALLENPRQRAARIGREGDHILPTQRVMTGTEMLEELVFIADGSRVSFASEPRFVLPLPEFKQFTAGSVEPVQLPDGRTIKKHRLGLWVEHPERKTVKTQTFAPGRDAVCISPRNEQAQNLWVPKVRNVPDNWQELAQPFFDHVAYLLPIEQERERFLDWVAHIEQAPGVLPSTHYLLVTAQTGIGRNWLAYALARTFAGHTALGFDLSATLRSGFNGELSQTLLAVVDELHEGGPSAASKPQAEKLKSLLTESTRLINPKYGRQHVEFNACRFLMFSNHEAALPLTENDRRVVVVQNPSERKPGDYYKRLYALLDHADLGDALAEAFRRRDLSRFNPGEIAPMNEAKRRTIRAGRSEIEQAVRDLAAEWPSDCITSSRMSREVSGALGGHISSTQGAGVAAGLTKYRSRVKVAGVAQHIWILRDQSEWANAMPADVAAETLRGEKVADECEVSAATTAGDHFKELNR
jgi:hypothetical protein